jgi:imidazolonepropionase-like amidohydrolase
LAGQDAIAIRAGTLIDGRGGVQRNVIIVIEDAKIKSVEPAAQQTVALDLAHLTLLPGLIDTHVHLATHFGKGGKATSEGETPQQSMLYAVENAYTMLVNGFTTAQSLGSVVWRNIRFRAPA